LRPLTINLWQGAIFFYPFGCGFAALGRLAFWPRRPSGTP
jgi:hypothetical protein